jgi:PCI domain
LFSSLFSSFVKVTSPSVFSSPLALYYICSVHIPPVLYSNTSPLPLLYLEITLDKFMHEARVMICEMYCTINRRVDLNMLADKLQMSEEESEKWMVEMVRNAGPGSNTLDAKIDSSAKQVGYSSVFGGVAV